MQIAILGPLEVQDAAGRRVDVAGSRLQSLLIRLALDAGRAVGTDALVEAVWGTRPPQEATNALQTLVSRLRRALGDAGLIAQSVAGYRLALAADAVDAHRFETLAADGAAALRAGNPQRAAEVLTEAQALWRGPMGDLDGAAAAGIDRLLARRHAAWLDRIDAELACGADASRLVAELEPLRAEHPLDERLAGLHLRALAAAGRPADALRAYERLRSRLAGELGVDPSAPVQQIHLALLRGELAPAVPATSRPNNLRAQLTSFVGRDTEVARIGKSLEKYRLVSLVGPGGAGKTRLATESAARIVDSAPDGVWLVELAAVTDGADVPQTVLGSLGLRESQVLDGRGKISTQDAESRLLEGLRDKRALIVLDNCEHLIDACARLVDSLLAHCSQLRVLATSREPLGILGESLLVVPPLGQPGRDAAPEDARQYPAVRLFVDRAVAVRPDFVLDADTVPVVIDIARRLDGLPLAIELAAARLRGLALPDIAARLSDRFRLLTGGSRTALPRHRTLRAVVEWSWDLLSDRERVLAERFAVFPSGANPDAVAAICVGGVGGVDGVDGVADVVASLVDKSLLQPIEGGRRVRMLETIREYGFERLAERDELAGLRLRHAEYFAQLMLTAEPHLLQRDQLRWLAQVTEERENILAALRCLCDRGAAAAALRLAVSMSGMAMLLGNASDVAAWIAEALAVPGETENGLRAAAEALLMINSTSMALSESPDEAQGRVARINDIVLELDAVKVSEHPMAALMKPGIAMFAGDVERMERWTAEALASPDPWVAAAARAFRANLAENNGDVEGMRADAAIALEQFRVLGERWGLTISLRTVAIGYTIDGNLEAATAAYGEALNLMRELGSREDESFLYGRLADLAVRREDWPAARAHLAQAQAASARSGSSMEAVFTSCMGAELSLRLGAVDEARELVEQARARLEAIPATHPVQGHACSMVGSTGMAVDIEAGGLETARASAPQLYTVAVQTHDYPIIAIIGRVFADLVRALGRPLEAARLLGACASLRGADDPTDPSQRRLRERLVVELGSDTFAAAYAEGRALERDAARDRLDPALLFA